MGELPPLTRIRGWIGGLAWCVFLWGNEMSAEDYWQFVYEEERARRRRVTPEPGEETP